MNVFFTILSSSMFILPILRRYQQRPAQSIISLMREPSAAGNQKLLFDPVKYISA